MASISSRRHRRRAIPPSALNSCAAVTLSIADVSVAEGDTGTTTATFTVSLNAPAPAGGVTFSIATADGTATTAGSDYLANSLSNQVIPGGQQSYAFDVPINGDLDLEADEAFTVEVTAISGARAGDTSAVGTILNDDVLTTPIHVIQGNGLESPFVNQLAAVRGVVTALKSNGFFVQTAIPSLEDGDPSTSEGLFVFTGSASTVAVGDLVTAHGTVFEFSGLTEISVPPSAGEEPWLRCGSRRGRVDVRNTGLWRSGDSARTAGRYARHRPGGEVGGADEPVRRDPDGYRTASRVRCAKRASNGACRSRTIR